MRINFLPHMKRLLVFVTQRASTRLERSRGAGNQMILPKLRPDGKRLGGRIARDLLSGHREIRQNGFRVTYPKHILRFNDGAAAHRQPPRKILGITPSEHEELIVATRAYAVAQINKGVK